MRDLRGWVERWWNGDAGPVGRALDGLLWPAEHLFRAGVAARGVAYDLGALRTRVADIPVISVGNLDVGGTGKTPVAAWIAAFLLEQGARPALVARGYGADEIAVHAELNPRVPVYADAQRHPAVQRAAADRATVAVLDDGFQYRALARDLDLVLLSADRSGDPIRMLPRGRYREPLRALRRADWVVVTRKAASATVTERTRQRAARWADRVAVCRLAPRCLRALEDPTGAPIPLSALRGRSVLLVTSLADPGAFASQVRALGANADLLAFPDHHPFDSREVASMLANLGGRTLVMTRKEAVKLRGMLPAATEAWFVEQEVEFEMGEAELRDDLRRVVNR